MTVKTWSTTADNNVKANTGIDVDEGWSPAIVNNSVRQIMADLRTWYDQMGSGGIVVTATVGGTANAITLTNADAFSALATGQAFIFKAGSTNTDDTTINVDGIGAAHVHCYGANLVGGEIRSGYWQMVVYDGTYFNLLTRDGRLSLAGAYTLALTMTANTGLTLPTTGTLATLAGSETLSNKTVSSSTLDNSNTIAVKAANLSVEDGTDITKIAKLDASGITTGTTRTFTLADASGTLAMLLNDLAALEALATTGLAARTGTSTWATRTLTGPAAGVSVSNGDGVSGNPTLALANDLAAVEGLSSTGIAVRTATDTWAQRQITSTGGTVTITNGDGVAGNINVEANVTGAICSALSSAFTYNSTTPADSGLTIALATGKTYIVEIEGVFTSGNTAGCVLATAGTASFSSFNGGYFVLQEATLASAGIGNFAASGTIFTDASSSKTSNFRVSLVAVCSGSGTLKVQVSNNSGTNTGTLKAGAWMRATATS